MQADRQLYQPLIEQVPPPVVGQLMAQGVLKISLRQTGVRQDDAGPAKPQQHGRGRQRVFVQLHGAVYPKLPAQLAQPFQQRNVRNPGASRPHISAEALVNRDLANQQQRRCGQPHRPDILPQYFARRPALVRRRLEQRPGGRRQRLELCALVWQGKDLRRRSLLEKRTRQANLRRQRQQQAGDRHQPDIILPPAAESLLHQRSGQQQEQYQQRAGKRQAQKHPEDAVHGWLSSQYCFSSS